MDSIYSSMLLVPGVVALLNTRVITLRTTLWSQPSQLAKQPSDSHKMPKSMCSWRHLWRHYPCPWARVKRCWIAQHDCASLWWLSPRDRGGLAWIITWREGFDGASGGRGVWLRKPPVNQNLKEICDVFWRSVYLIECDSRRRNVPGDIQLVMKHSTKRIRSCLVSLCYSNEPSSTLSLLWAGLNSP